MMSSESSFKLIPSDYMISRKHAIVVIPPQTCRATKLLRGKTGFVSLRAWYCQQSKLGLNGIDPSIRIKRFLRAVEQRRLCPKEIWVCCNLGLVVIASTSLLLVLLLLPLDNLAKQLSLCSQYFCKTRGWRWRWWFTTTTCLKATGVSTSTSHHLKYMSSSISNIIHNAPKMQWIMVE